MQFGSAEPLETMGQAGASIKCIYAESDKITQFLANAVFDEGEEQKVSSLSVVSLGSSFTNTINITNSSDIECRTRSDHGAMSPKDGSAEPYLFSNSQGSCQC